MEALEIRQVDVIGDVHGCAGELQLLLERLGYRLRQGRWFHPEGRVAAFLGDLVDRGPANVETLLLVAQLVEDGCGLIASIGNHDLRLYEKLVLRVEPSKRLGGLAATLEEIASSPDRALAVQAVERLFKEAPPFTVFDGGALVVVHAALRPALLWHLPSSDRSDDLSQLCAFGETTGETDQEGRLVRTFNWVELWPEETTVAFGHNVCGDVPIRYGHGNVVALDSGCVFGGALSCLRWPENKLVSVPAQRDDYTQDSPVKVSGIEPHAIG